MNDKQRNDLRKKLTNLGEIYNDLKNKDKDLKELIRIIGNPGWTTPAEHFFVSTIIYSLQKQGKLMQALHNALLSGSTKVQLK